MYLINVEIHHTEFRCLKEVKKKKKIHANFVWSLIHLVGVFLHTVLNAKIYLPKFNEFSVFVFVSIVWVIIEKKRKEIRIWAC